MIGRYQSVQFGITMICSRVIWLILLLFRVENLIIFTRRVVYESLKQPKLDYDVTFSQSPQKFIQMYSQTNYDNESFLSLLAESDVIVKFRAVF